MAIFKKIIVPLDGSPLAEVAMPYAEELAAKLGSDIILLTVLPSGEAEEFQNHTKYADKMVDIARSEVEKYSEEIEKTEINIGTATRVGNPAEGILNYVNKGYRSLIVMATHGRSGIGRWALGSIADKIVRSTLRQPLLLIRAKGNSPDVRAGHTLKKTLLPLDGTMEGEAVIPYTSAMARRLGMELTLLRIIPKANHTNGDAEYYLLDWCRRLNDEGLSADYELKTGAPADQIIDFANEHGFDLVAMSTHGQNSINPWTLGSVAQKVLLAGNTPLLLIRA